MHSGNMSSPPARSPLFGREYLFWALDIWCITLLSVGLDGSNCWFLRAPHLKVRTEKLAWKLAQVPVSMSGGRTEEFCDWIELEYWTQIERRYLCGRERLITKSSQILWAVSILVCYKSYPRSSSARCVEVPYLALILRLARVEIVSRIRDDVCS